MSSYKPVTNVLDFNVALKPSKAFPLDPRTMFGSYEEALAAAATAEDAGSDKTIYYFGQTVTVYEDGVAKSYLIQPDDSGKGTLVTVTLPPVTEAENGKFLQVVGGAWGAGKSITELYTEIDERIDKYIEEALGGEY